MRRLPRLPAWEWALLCVALLSAGAGAALPALLRSAWPQVAVDAWTHHFGNDMLATVPAAPGIGDPWGRPWAVAVPETGETWWQGSEEALWELLWEELPRGADGAFRGRRERAHHAYSVGANGVDEAGGGDDLVVDPTSSSGRALSWIPGVLWALGLSLGAFVAGMQAISWILRRRAERGFPTLREPLWVLHAACAFWCAATSYMCLPIHVQLSLDSFVPEAGVSPLIPVYFAYLGTAGLVFAMLGVLHSRSDPSGELNS